MLFFICCVWVFLLVRPVLLECDRSMNTDVYEGNIGEVGLFSWIGVLRTKIFTIKENKVALTGIVLVRDRYCIGYADDVAKIPKRNMEDTTRAMFIPMDQKPWHSKVKDYMMHPEFDYSTMNTIALIELDLEYVTQFPVTPICWPPKTLQTPTDLFVIGYTDENKLLEKVMHKVNYVTQDVCKEFYERQQPLIVERLEDHNKICAVAQNNKKNCEWDNGMVLASNSTGVWTLIGFSLQGPGCSAPSRFIDLTQYLNWIETSSTLDHEEIYRKSGGDTVSNKDYLNKKLQDKEFRKSGDTDHSYLNKESKFKVPEDITTIHDNYASKPARDNYFFRPRNLDYSIKDQSFRKPEEDTEFNEEYSDKEHKDNTIRKPVDNTEFHENMSVKASKANAYRKIRDYTELYVDDLDKDLINSTIIRNREEVLNTVNKIKNSANNFRIQRIASNAISIDFNTNTDSGDCTISKAIVYRECMPLKSNKTNFTTVLIKIPVIDLMYMDYDCVSLKVKTKTKYAYLWYNVTKKNSNHLKKTTSNKIAKQRKRRYDNSKEHVTDILFLKLKFFSTADFIYLVYSKESIINSATDKSTTHKVLSKFKENTRKSVKLSDKAMSSNKMKPRTKSDRRKPQTELFKRNIKINDIDLKQKLKIINHKIKEPLVPLPLHSKTNQDDGFLNGIKSIILGMYKNYMTLNLFLTLLIIFAIVYMLLGLLIRKGYVRL